MRTPLAALGVLLGLIACTQKPATPSADVNADANAPAPPPAGAPKHPDAPGIDWFDGSVDAAFDAARAQNKPVLLFWGAKWCPWCQVLKATVFTRADFRDKTKLFVPVYLDGDDAGAQKWGETFAIQGYPTMLILDAERHEVQRIAGNMDVNQYAGLLDMALGDVQPVEALLRTAAGGGALTQVQCRRLAFNGWGLEDIPAEQLGGEAQKLLQAAAQCPPSAAVERARLSVFATAFAADAEADALDKGGKPGSTLAAALTATARVLEKPDLAMQAVDALQGLGPNVFKAAKLEGAKFAEPFGRSYIASMRGTLSDVRFSAADQLGALASLLQAQKAFAPDGKLPQQDIDAAQQRVIDTLGAESRSYVRSGIIDAGLSVFEEIGATQTAYDIVKAELGNTATPYYYKADLGQISEKLGHNDEALKWYAEGYRESRGAATRFQWGALYASALLRLAPADAKTILATTGQVLGELDGTDRLYRRARMRLTRLEKALQAWQQNPAGRDQAATLKALRARMQQICVKIPAGDAARQSCDGFLAQA